VLTVEKIGAVAPLDLSFVDDTGAKVALRDYFDGQRPVVLNFVYYECPLLCNLVLEGVLDGMRDAGKHPGTDYRLLTLSVNPRERPKLAAAKKAAYLGALEMSGIEWAFLTGEEANIRAFADSVGWGYRYDPETSEYIHGAVTLVLSPTGSVVRYLHGSRPGGLQLRLALAEAGSDASLGDALVGFLYPYDTAARKYAVSLSAAL
jgi:protein SCO1/2